MIQVWTRPCGCKVRIWSSVKTKTQTVHRYFCKRHGEMLFEAGIVRKELERDK